MTGAPRAVPRPLRSPLVPAVAVVVALVVGVLLLLHYLGGGSHTLVARFRDVSGLVTGNEVRIAGIEAGTVERIDLRRDPQHGPCAAGAAAGSCDPHAQPGNTDEYAEVTLSIKGDRWPLHAGTVVAVRPKGTLSNVDVTITPGPLDAQPLHDGQVFDFNGSEPQTSWPITLDALNDVFGSYSRDPKVLVTDSLKTQIAEGQRIFGNGGAPNLNATLANLNPLTRDLAPLTQVLADRTPELHRLNGEFDTILHDVATEDASLRGVLENGNRLFSVIAARQNDLQGTLDHAATTFHTLNTTLDGEEGNLETILAKAPALLDKARQASSLLFPVIDQVDPHIPHLDVLLHEFITATGFVASDLTSGKPVDTLRVDGSIGTKTAFPCGGQAVSQLKCSSNPAVAAPALGGAAVTTTDASTSPLAGGLFG